MVSSGTPIFHQVMAELTCSSVRTASRFSSASTPSNAMQVMNPVAVSRPLLCGWMK